MFLKLQVTCACSAFTNLIFTFFVQKVCIKYYTICSVPYLLAIICALFFPILAAEKSGCVKYADFFCGGLDLGFILVQLRIRYVLLIFYCNFVT